MHPNDGCRAMSMDEFKQWLKWFDSNKYGSISIKELSHTIRTNGGGFKRRKGKETLGSADCRCQRRWVHHGGACRSCKENAGPQRCTLLLIHHM
ncbi:hypothetical protein SAY86_004403 [Trapa natans]|uniref:EF-hand domain-containing protein n=1 Tax=Trapa natans TaxID=22666 RepID=A0AAN7RNT4_TRANT|nr:hypothetical protein SAY86_004403 [Trapa natans]